MSARMYTDEQFLICSLARELRDDETIAVGNLSPIPAAAALLAQATHAPQATVYMLGQPDWPFDGTKEFFDFLNRGGVDVFFLSGAQIDRFGSLNLQAVGDYRRPKVRLPGGAGSAVVAFASKRILLFKTDHTVKGFPERLDVTTSTFLPAEDVWRRGRLDGVFTPLGTLRPEQPGGALRLTETAPDRTPEEVQAHTGFDLRAEADGISAAEPPTRAELEALRSTVFERLLPVYPVFARRGLLGDRAHSTT